MRATFDQQLKEFAKQNPPRQRFFDEIRRANMEGSLLIFYGTRTGTSCG